MGSERLDRREGRKHSARSCQDSGKMSSLRKTFTQTKENKTNECVKCKEGQEIAERMYWAG